MQQTILAILALMLITFFSVTQLQSMRGAYNAMIGDEMEVMASGVALQVLDKITSAAFDQNTRQYSDPDYVPITTATGLKKIPIRDDPDMANPSKPGKKCAIFPGSTGGGYANCNDISDFHNMEWETFTYPIRGDLITFEVSAVIQYVEFDNPEQATGNGGRNQSFRKEITVRARLPLSADSTAIRYPEIQLQRTVACPVAQCEI